MSEPASFVGNHAALDFLNTIAAPHGEVIESIVNGENYLTWLVDVELIHRTDRQGLLNRFGATVLDRVAAEARDLREWFRHEIAKPASTRWRSAELIAKLNQMLAIDCTHCQLESSGRHLVLRERRVFTQARQLLVPVAQIIAELVTDADPLLIKRCANPPCTLWFYDRTKAHRRRFCSASVCGNRAKVAAFRERQRQAE